MRISGTGNKSLELSRDEAKTLQFVSMFVHDLEGPLASVKTLLRLLERQKFDLSKPIHSNLLRSSLIALERSEDIIYDLMATARAGQTNLIVSREDCNLNELIIDCCRMADPVAAESKIQIRPLLIQDDIIVRADRLLINRVLDNLIYNAIMHTPSDGKVIIEATADNEFAEVIISDTGSGFKDIDPEDLFTIYRQTDYRILGLHRGVGIGLYFCRMAINKMGGKISAEKGKDKGAVFRFTIPCRGMMK